MAGDWADDVHNDISLDLHFHRYCSFACHFTERFWRLDRWTHVVSMRVTIVLGLLPIVKFLQNAGTSFTACLSEVW